MYTTTKIENLMCGNMVYNSLPLYNGFLGTVLLFLHVVLLSSSYFINVLSDFLRCRLQGDGYPRGVWHRRRSPRRRWTPGKLQLKGDVGCLRRRLHAGRHKRGKGEQCVHPSIRCYIISVRGSDFVCFFFLLWRVVRRRKEDDDGHARKREITPRQAG